MNPRLYPIYLALLSFTEVALAADPAAWNCQQGKNGEWTCLNQGQPEPAPSATPTNEPSTSTAPVAQSAPALNSAPSQPAISPNASTATAVKTTDAQTEPAPQKLRASIGQNQKPVLEKVPARSEPPSAVAKQAGWSCKTGAENNNWNCNLVGKDPKGEPQTVSDSDASTAWLTPTYSNQQERTFNALRSEFKHDPWQNCSNWSAKKRKIAGTAKETRDSANTDILADFSEVFDGEILNFAGNVDLTRADQHLLADKASYDTVADTLDAQGNTIYSEDALALSSETLSLNLGRDEARVRKLQFIAAEAPFRGTAEVMYRDSKALSRYHDATFTSCPPGNQDWIMHASRVKINRETGQGSAKNTWLEFKGIPVLYTPYISFPTDSRRTTGLLSPTWGNTQRNGFDVAMPFYWNIAPNYDTTITPRFMANRGGMLRNQFRYLTESSAGRLAGEIMPHDDLRDQSRYSANFRDNTRFTDHLSATTDLNYVSDKEYFNDMNNALGFQTNRFLASRSFLNYNRPGVSFATGVQHYQSVDRTITDAGMPYDVLPRVSLNLNHDFEQMPLNLAMQNQYSHFYHSELVNGQRFNFAPSVSLPLESTAGFFIPKITGQYTQYELTSQTSVNQPNSVSRALPIFSVDSGLLFEKQLDAGYTHTIEPRAFYLYIPRKDQNDIPVFDTAGYDTNYYSLFRENRFSGFDRIQDANQITLAGTSRLIDSKTGLEPLKVSLGQIIYFQDRTVNLPGVATQTSSTSNFVGEVGGQMTQHLSYSTGAQWDPITNGFARAQALLKYRNQPDEIFDIGYRWRNSNPNDSIQIPNDISQSDVSFRWPVAAGWYALGRWQYSFYSDDDRSISARTTESFIGIEKETCCWRLRVIGRRYINGANNNNFISPDARPENAVFVQLELKGLTGFGDQVDQFLQRNLNGYRPASYFDD